MRHWEIGVDVEQRTAAYCLEEAPWWVFALESAVDWLCDHLPSIPLPHSPESSGDSHATDASIAATNTRSWFHLQLHAPLGRWLEDQKQQFWLPASYDAVKQRHPAERQMIEDLEDFVVEERAA